MVVELEEKLNTALELQRNNKIFEAECLFREILIKNPNNAQVLNLLGMLKFNSKSFNEAVTFLEKAVAIKPIAKYYRNLGQAYIEAKDFYNAIGCYKNAIKLEFNNYDAWFYLAFALNENEQIDDSIIAYQKAIELNPTAINAYRNLGNIYYSTKNNPEMAVVCYEKFLENDPENMHAKGALGAAYLKTKRYEKGWEYFEARPNKKIVVLIRALIPNNPIKTKPLWQGEDIKNKTIYVYYEGGFGDTIMFSRYLPLLKSKCKEVLFRPQVGSIELFKENSLGVNVLDTCDSEEALNFDVHTTIMCLPYLLRSKSEKDIPLTEGYLKANPEKAQIYKNKYLNNDKFKIGIKWQGNVIYDITRCINIKHFQKIFDIPNTKFYSLQKDEGIEQLNRVDNCELVDLGSTFNDFADTAAAIENLDLVICNDTSVAHLAAAMGKECWMLLPFIQDWRWTNDLSYCVWYKSVKFFQQTAPQDWDEVFNRVCQELKNKLLCKYN